MQAKDRRRQKNYTYVRTREMRERESRTYLSRSRLELRVQMENASYIKPIRGAIAHTDHKTQKPHS
jgi:hypothetical protein